MDAAPLDDFWAVIPAGGAGTRLWPLSRRSAPKFLHDLTGSGRTLLQGTVDRLRATAGDRIIVVTGAAHEQAVREQLPELGGDALLAEPSPRDSMAAIGLAAAVLERRSPDAVLGSFAADHVIDDAAGFGAAVSEAVEAARAGWLVTLGVRPTHPATGFGYIRPGEPLAGHPAARVAAEFVEKPDAAAATAYVAEGCLWNAGMFVVRPGVLLDLLHEGHPELADGLRAIAADPGRLSEIWATLTAIAIDHAVAEPAAAAGRVAVVPAAFDWDDVGDFASLDEVVRDGAEPGMQVLGDRGLVITASPTDGGLVVPGSGRIVAVVGLDDVVVVDTPDALLVTTRAAAQQVKAVVAELAERGRDDLS